MVNFINHMLHLPLPPMTDMNNDENEIKYREKNSTESPLSSTSMRVRSATTTVVPIITRPTINSYDETFNLSSSNKIPLWKRFKKMIVPQNVIKKNKIHLYQIMTYQSTN